MIQAIDDLDKRAAKIVAASEEARRASTAQVAPLPPPPFVPQTPVCDLGSLATYLPAKERKTILSQITPLAKDRFPEPTDLSSFWLQVEEAIRSLHPTL
jgi:hypothetical protein